ncbi:MAG: alpha/beta hydrolase-fold protein [Henriciella sp.]|nr:alpha/beta hydrolase-fold protein [Henriciella sp.]
MVRTLALALALAGLTACGAPAPSSGEVSTEPDTISTPSQLVRLEAVPSEHVAPRNVTLWLPPDYDPDGEPYPVIYAHDGQNLFEPGTAYGGTAWELDDIAEQLIAEDKIRAPIIVGLWNTGETRWLEYMPRKILDGVPEAAFDQTGEDREAPHTRPSVLSDAYLRFIVEEMKPYVDANYNSAPGPEDTFVMGSSMGGLISLYAISEYPDVFSRAACVSTHWPLALANGPVADAATDAVLSFLEDGALDNARHSLWFDHGTLGLDANYARHAEPIEAWFRNAGWGDTEARFTVFEGTDHNEASWQERSDQILIFLLGKES